MHNSLMQGIGRLRVQDERQAWAGGPDRDLPAGRGARYIFIYVVIWPFP